MAIKFGDLIENINADQAVIDLLSNNAKGLLFVGDFSDTAADGDGVQGVPLSKRGLYTIVLDQSTGNLYAYIGDNLDVGNDQSGYWEDTTSTGTNWVQIGQVPVRETSLFANINPGPDPSQADQQVDTPYANNSVANLNKLRKFVYEMYQNPQRLLVSLRLETKLLKLEKTSMLWILSLELCLPRKLMT